MCHRRDKHYPFAFATVGDSRTWKYEKTLEKVYKRAMRKCRCFPIDGLPDCPKEIKRFYSAISLKGKSYKVLHINWVRERPYCLQ